MLSLKWFRFCLCLTFLNASRCSSLFPPASSILVQAEMGLRGKDLPPCKLASHLSPELFNHWRFSTRSSPSINSTVQRAGRRLSEASFLVKRAGLQDLRQPQLTGGERGGERELLRAIQGALFAETLTTVARIKQASCGQLNKEEEWHPLPDGKEDWKWGRSLHFIWWWQFLRDTNYL